jgi:hypothetical protein
LEELDSFVYGHNHFWPRARHRTELWVGIALGLRVLFQKLKHLLLHFLRGDNRQFNFYVSRVEPDILRFFCQGCASVFPLFSPNLRPSSYLPIRSTRSFSSVILNNIGIFLAVTLDSRSRVRTAPSHRRPTGVVCNRRVEHRNFV